MKRLFSALALVAAMGIGTTPTFAHGDLEDAMKDIKRTFKKLRRARDTEAMRPLALTLAEQADVAAAIPLHGGDASAEDQAEYEQRMEQFSEYVAELQAAIDAGDQEGAEEAIEAMGEAQDDGHDYFDVED